MIATIYRFLFVFGISLPVYAAESGVLAIHLSTKGNDITFDQNAVEVPFSKEIKIRFVNQATHDSQIAHNIAILKPKSLDKVIADLQKWQYDLAKMAKHPSVLVMTKALDPGQEETLVFNPRAPGYYPYICLMAGHGDMLNMRGVLHVKKSK